MPGDVFTSRSHGAPAESSIRSTRPQPEQPSALKESSARFFSDSSFGAGSPQGQMYFVSSVNYLFR